MPADEPTNLEVAEQVSTILASEAIPSIVIGAVALAAHRYVRFTEDIDLGVVADAGKMRALVDKLRSGGFEVQFHTPDGDDPLGGVIDIFGSFGLVQVVNFDERFPAAIHDALSGEDVRVSPSSPLRIIPIPQLVALKLYAGGLKSKSDILELLRRNPEIDVEEIRETCRRYRLEGLDEILKELGP
ncbi:conserved hypothetical protein [Haloferula helveola]|uniref:Nucleotidyltransferase family protein n=1 Tax=Haloferula helveola TaxID=490095 RepID=A0ABM7REP1_9BACT|nr:conserved hypothetical protein [Haloferula helveola]